MDRACIIGAGPSGLVAGQALKERGIPFDCYEKGSQIGGQWRYQNDSGLSSTYASLVAMCSQRHMQFDRFPMPRKFDEFPTLEQVIDYLDAFVDRFQLRDSIKFRACVTSVQRTEQDKWKVVLADGASSVYRHVIIANGHLWSPAWPVLKGEFSGEITHSQKYRTPNDFTGKRVAVVGFGTSAADIACEISTVAKATYLSIRGSGYILPRQVLRRPFDAFDTRLSSRLPWPILRLLIGLLSKPTQTRAKRAGVPAPHYKLLHRVPILCEELLTRIEAGSVSLKPTIECLADRRAHFIDGSEEEVDCVLCATGYKPTFPFLSRDVFKVEGSELPLYRRIVHPDQPGLYFLGLVDAIGGLLPVFEAQAQWAADVIGERMALPEADAMQRAMLREQKRLKKRFVDAESPATWLLCDRFPYIRSLAREQRFQRGRWRLYKPRKARRSPLRASA